MMGAKRFAGARRLWDRLLHEPLTVPRNPIGPFAVMTSDPVRSPRTESPGLGAAGEACESGADCASGVCVEHRRGGRCARGERGRRADRPRSWREAGGERRESG